MSFFEFMEAVLVEPLPAAGTLDHFVPPVAGGAAVAVDFVAVAFLVLGPFQVFWIVVEGGGDDGEFVAEMRDCL